MIHHGKEDYCVYEGAADSNSINDESLSLPQATIILTVFPKAQFVYSQMARPNHVLITGAKSGIGRELLRAYAARDDTVAIAAVRGGLHSGPGKALQSLPTGANSSIIVVDYDATSKASADDMVTELRSTHGIHFIDVVIANAGLLNQWGPVRTVEGKELMDSLVVNTLGPIKLYQATISLLDKAEHPKLFFISSSMGSNALMDQYVASQMIAYNMSKSAVNFAAGRIHREEDHLVVCPVHPGWIATAMGSKAAELRGKRSNSSKS
jgi:norsolorinic acid ketoreductase